MDLKDDGREPDEPAESSEGVFALVKLGLGAEAAHNTCIHIDINILIPVTVKSRPI